MDERALDQQLVNSARDLIRKRYREDWHAVAPALRTKSGRIYLGVHLECYIGRVTVCAEAIAIGAAVTAGEGSEINTIVAVRQSSKDDTLPGIVAPCGMCREMISDYAPNARVLIPSAHSQDSGDQDHFAAVDISSLLPHKYTRA